MTHAAYDRYERQIALPEIGLAGQKLHAAHIAVIGAGGLALPRCLIWPGLGSEISRFTITTPSAPITSTARQFIRTPKPDKTKPRPLQNI